MEKKRTKNNKNKNRTPTSNETSELVFFHCMCFLRTLRWQSLWFRLQILGDFMQYYKKILIAFDGISLCVCSKYMAA